MSWKDKYQQGSFRGVEFFMRGHTLTGGRDIAKHKFPGRDVRFNEDTGRSERTFQLTVYVLGDNYFTQRDDLRAAFDTVGPGRLVHPYLGVFNVVVGSFSLTEDSENGRIASFEVSMAEDLPGGLTVATIATGAAVTAVRLQLMTAVTNDFISKYPKSFLLPGILKAAQDAITAASSAVTAAKKSVSDVAAYRQQVQNIAGSIIALSLDAVLLSKNITSLVDWGMDPLNKLFAPTPNNASTLLNEMQHVQDTVAGPTSLKPIGTAGGDVSAQVLAYTSAISVASAVGITSLVPLTTAEDAEALRLQVFAMLDGIQSVTDNDDVFYATTDAKRTISDDLNRRILTLSTTIDYKTPESEPVLSIAQELYGDPTRSQEILDHNAIRHPGFCPASEPMKVLI